MTCLWVNRPQKNSQTDFATDRGDFSPEKAALVMKYGIGQIARQREQKGPRDGAIFANAVQKWLIENTRLGESARQLKKITLKAFANFSPGFAMKPWVKKAPFFGRNSEGVATRLRFGGRRATLSGLRLR
jgi:hypothetical protein